MPRGPALATLAAAAALLGCAGHSPGTLGVRDGRLSPCPDSPNCVSSQETGERHSIAPLPVVGDPATAQARLTAAIEARGDATIVSSSPDYLRVEFHTRLGFVDDAEFWLDRAARVIHVRSGSRVGYSDFGKNRSRIEELRKALLGSG
ncbi:MAG: DUF1499 domain-containing protein [Deltaproteobacteria bacterium]|nr:DUF1499 domain-containing protein [Deltaproteobacteria bacterium]